MDIKLSLSIPIFKWINSSFFKLKNFISRPKVEIKVYIQPIVFIENNTEHHFHYLCLTIANNTKNVLHLNPRNIRINNELYQVIIQGDTNFARLNPASTNKWDDCKNEVFKMYQSNWLDISTNRYLFTLNPFEQKIFPLKLIKSGSHIITNRKKESLLFFPKSKISVSLEINKKNHEYGLDRISVYETYINYLAFYSDTN